MRRSFRIELAHFQRDARRPDLTSVQRHGKRSDAWIAREIERRAEGGRVVRVFGGVKALFEVIPNGAAWLVRSVSLDSHKPIGTFLSAADALRGGDAWVAEQLARRSNTQSDSGLDGDAA